MQKKRKIISNAVVGVAALAIVFMTGCKKDAETPPTKEQLLSAHDWKIKSLTIPSVNTPGADSSILQTCDTASVLSFSSQYSFQFVNGNSGGCSGTRFFYDSGSWSFHHSGDSLHLHGVTRDYIWKVHLLTDTSLEASYLDSLSPSLKWITKIVLKNQ